jgi:hypothetical protein
MWRQVTLREQFDALEGRTIIGRASRREDVLHNPKGWSWDADFEAIQLDNGVWLVVENSEGEPDYSSWTPGSPGFTNLWLFTP